MKNLCWFCQKRVWFWQKEFAGYHRRCYSDYLNALPDEIDPPGMFIPELGIDERSRFRHQILADLREMRQKYPELKLRVPLQ